MKIIVTHRENDYMACLEGNSAAWGCGKSTDEAIGDLINSHPEAFGIAIENR